MKNDYDVVAMANHLIEEWGEHAPRVSKVRLVELIAANNLRAASFWREVMRLCESIVTEHRREDSKGQQAKAPSPDFTPPRAA
ncbi:hypothetical protein [Arenibaculum pallidiluteum]|uniref:hypothetical protein n=1 Tax=Arenibaculum pallidiluteum TaxID=2812559 RepID=UPI001A966D50|nr:hypothetical protein [Arenibaculum pallidiluteum]